MDEWCLMREVSGGMSKMSTRFFLDMSINEQFTTAWKAGLRKGDTVPLAAFVSLW